MTTALLIGAALVFTRVLLRRVVSLRRRQRRLVREAVHELRRPLAAYVLAVEPGPRTDALREQIEVALRDLDAALEGSAAPRPSERTTLARLLDEARLRWRGNAVRIEAGPADAVLAADRIHLGMALDNLIANGLEHGAGEVRVDARRVEGGCRVEVSNGLPRPAPPSEHDPARGHGLRIAARELEREGGRLVPPRCTRAEVVAAIELPAARSLPTDP
jgi:signal transduction histidine kinase